VKAFPKQKLNYFETKIFLFRQHLRYESRIVFETKIFSFANKSESVSERKINFSQRKYLIKHLRNESKIISVFEMFFRFFSKK